MSRRPRFYDPLTFAQPRRHPVGDHCDVMRKLFALLATLVLLAGAGAAAAGAHGGLPPFPELPGNWSHAEINVKLRGTPHTLILDRGRIVQAGPLELTLREADGSIVTVPLATTTTYTWRGIGVRRQAVRRGLFALTMRVDQGAAVRVRLSLFR